MITIPIGLAIGVPLLTAVAGWALLRLTSRRRATVADPCPKCETDHMGHPAGTRAAKLACVSAQAARIATRAAELVTELDPTDRAHADSGAEVTK